MTLLSLTDCCRLLAIDPKTLRRWLEQAQLTVQTHPRDARLKGLTDEQLRLLATAHHRSLPALPGEFALPAPTGSLPEPSPLPPELLDLLQQLRALPAQMLALQQQMVALTQRLESPPLLACPAHDGKAAGRSLASAPTPARLRPTPASAQKPLPPPVHVLPRVEYGSQGRYVVISPKHGLLPLEPDTPAWFAWLETLSSFRFVGKLGYFSAHHEWRIPRGAWRAHRQIRNHSYTLRLAPTHDLTIAVLEQTAEALQAHLK